MDYTSEPWYLLLREFLLLPSFIPGNESGRKVLSAPNFKIFLLIANFIRSYDLRQVSF